MKRWLFASGILSVVLTLGEADVAYAQAVARPTEPALQFTGTETYQANRQVLTRYKLAVANWQAFPDQMFERIGNGANPSRTHVTIRDENGKTVYEFTALGRAQDLTGLWFATKVGEKPPRAVYIELYDRVLKIRYTSTPVRLR